MENVEIARVFSEVADLLEIQGANPFRVRAYRNAVRTIEGLTRSLAEMGAHEEDLEELPGIGKDIAGYIRELVQTGELRLLRAIEKRVPETLADLLTLEGIGPKRAAKLWKKLGVECVDDLALAIDDGRVRELRGFGEKTVEKLRRSIAAFRKRAGRALLSEADQLVKPLLAHMAEAPGIEKLDVAGSYRRRRETVGSPSATIRLLSGSISRRTKEPGAWRAQAEREVPSCFAPGYTSICASCRAYPTGQRCII